MKWLQVTVIPCCLVLVAAWSVNFAFCTKTTTITKDDDEDTNDGRQVEISNPCQPATEFYCKLEKRCLPLEMRCDFLEQCLDGEDELGCPPESCNFKHNRCYWLNDLPKLLFGTKMSRQSNLWRRYTVTGPSEGRQQQQREGVLTVGLSVMLEKLSSGLSAGEKFIFVGAPPRLNPKEKAPTWRQRPIVDDKLFASATIRADGAQSLLPAAGQTTDQPRGTNNNEENAIESSGENNGKQTLGAGPSKAGQPANKLVTLRRRARMLTPEIGRTSAMCQLRFEYALWASGASVSAMMDEARAAGGGDGEGGPRGRGGGASRSQVVQIETTLRLVARERSLKATSESHTNDEQQQQTIRTKILWSRQVDWSHRGTDNNNNSNDEGGNNGRTPRPYRPNQDAQIDYQSQPLVSSSGNESCGSAAAVASSLDWTVGVAELGHLKLATLAFEVESLMSIEQSVMGSEHENGHLEQERDASRVDALEVGINSPLVTTNNDYSDESQQRQPASVQFAGSLVALKWLKFHECHEWPSAEGLPPANNENEDENLAGQRGGDLPPEAQEEDDELVDAQACTSIDCLRILPNLPASRGPTFDYVKPCGPSEFRCQNGLCLAQDRLCNFVNECLSGSGPLVETNGDSANTSACLQVPGGGDDESPDLCGSILGRENFETSERQVQLFLTSRPRKFWHLSGNWTMSRVGLRRRIEANSYETFNQQQLLHLPQVDHTTRSSHGTYLSLELPITTTTSSRVLGASAASHRDLYWVAIKSQWMQKLNGREFGECRLKFFYNLISSSQVTSGARLKSLFAPLERGGLELSLAVELFTLSDEFVSSNLSRYHDIPSTNASHLLNRKLVTFIHSNRELDLTRLERANKPKQIHGGHPGQGYSTQPIDLPGVDFWREANVNLDGDELKEGDLFLIRLVLYAEVSLEASGQFDREAGGLERLTINLDDLSTHFGCGPIEDAATLEQLDELSERHWLARGGPFRASDYLEPIAPPQPPLQVPIRGADTLPRLKHKWDYFWPELERGHQWWELARSRRTPSASSSFVDENLRQQQQKQHQQQQLQIEPQKLVACVLGAFCLIIGLIALIVFVLVPHVERAMMNYQDQIQLSLSGEYSDSPIAQSSSLAGVGPAESATTTTNFLRPSSARGSHKTLPPQTPFIRLPPRLLSEMNILENDDCDSFDWATGNSGESAHVAPPYTTTHLDMPPTARYSGSNSSQVNYLQSSCSLSSSSSSGLRCQDIGSQLDEASTLDGQDNHHGGLSWQHSRAPTLSSSPSSDESDFQDASDR